MNVSSEYIQISGNVKTKETSSKRVQVARKVKRITLRLNSCEEERLTRIEFFSSVK